MLGMMHPITAGEEGSFYGYERGFFLGLGKKGPSKSEEEGLLKNGRGCVLLRLGRMHPAMAMNEMSYLVWGRVVFLRRGLGCLSKAWEEGSF